MELTHDHFIVIYKILSALEANMDTGQPIDSKLWSAQALGISEQRFGAYLEMLSDSGYIKGVELGNYMQRRGTEKLYMRTPVIRYTNAKITLKGLEYLAENTLMQRAYKAINKITDLIP